MKPYKASLKKSSRHLRSNMTDAEQLLWKHIRGRQIHGLQFNRQKPLLNYIVDFYCASARIVVELDGGQHFEVQHQQKDNKRDQDLLELGLLVMRFDNRQVLTETDNVIEEIYASAAKRTHYG